MIFENTFDNLTEADKGLLQEYFDGYDYQSSSHTFLANYIWRNTHHLSWQVIGEYLCVAGRGDVGEDERVYLKRKQKGGRYGRSKGMGRDRCDTDL